LTLDQALVGVEGAAGKPVRQPRHSTAAVGKSGRYDSLIQPGQDDAPEREDYTPGETVAAGEVFDAAAYRALELDDLFERLDTVKLTLGRCALQRGLTSPSTDVAGVRARQEALLEIESSAELRDRLQSLVDFCADGEESLFDLVWADFNGPFGLSSMGKRPREGFGYEAFKATRRLFDRLVAFAGVAPRKSAGPLGRLIDSVFRLKPPAPRGGPGGESPVRSSFLNGLFEDLRQLRDSRSYRLLSSGIVTESGPKTRDEMPWYAMGYRFRPTLFKPLLIVVAIVLGAIGVEYYKEVYGQIGTQTMLPLIGLFAFSAIIPVLAIYFFMVGSAERDSFMKPVGEAIGSDPAALRALDALGEIGALLALARFRDRFPAATCMPEILDEKHHSLKVKGIRNPVIAFDEPSYVANDAEFQKARLSFITGPNSGGKTALCKTVLQCQALAQMGSFVPADEAAMSPADRIFYQIPQPGQLERHEGRFATELSRTRDIFFGCTPMSITVLDEPFEGTSFEERLTVSRQVLDGFVRLGSSTIFITHNHALARSYRKKGGGRFQFLMTDFDGNHPTYRFKKGIASHSHAESVAEEIGFGKEDIEKRFQNQD
jgi:hypothetical protein